MQKFEIQNNEVVVGLPIEDVFIISGTIENEMKRAVNSGIPDNEWYVKMSRIKGSLGAIIDIIRSRSTEDMNNENPTSTVSDIDRGGFAGTSQEFQEAMDNEQNGSIEAVEADEKISETSELAENA